MERNVKISLEKAREWYNSGNESLREVALQAFNEEELIEKPWEKIKTFEDACRVLIYHGVNPGDVDWIWDYRLQNLYKLEIIRRALNGVDWEPKLNTGKTYYPLMRYYSKGRNYNFKGTPVANFKSIEDNKVYTLVGGDYNYFSGGLGYFGDGYGNVSAYRGLLGCKSEEIAAYFGITFGKLIFDTIYGQYNNHIWLD